MAETGPEQVDTSSSLTIAAKNSSPQVIAIIVAALLLAAAILLPVFRKSRMSAYNGACLANIRRCAAGMIMYADENDGALPDSAAWMDRIEKYVPIGGDEDTAMKCPAVGKGEYGYAMSDDMGFAILANLKKPSKLALLSESSDLQRNAHAKTIQLPTPLRHSKTGVVFADGHAETFHSGQKL